MKVMILAAGLGERMRPLTDHTPKPLLSAGGMPLIEHHIQRLAAGGFREIVINVSHLAQQVMDYCGDGDRWGVEIAYSQEESPLETAGGIHRALPLLGTNPFLVVNGDIWIDVHFPDLREVPLRVGEMARLVMVDNPPQHPLGDFLLDTEGWVSERSASAKGLTYAGVGVYSTEFFAGMEPGKLPLRPLLDAAIARRALGGVHHAGRWADVGTPQRLAELDVLLTGEGPA